MTARARPSPARMPPGVKSSVPASSHVPTIAGRNSTSEVPSSSSSRGARRASPPRRLVVDQRIGRERQRLVEQEQREQVLGEGDADGAAERDREADVEGGLARLGVGPHVADRIDRVHDPQRPSDQREQQAERLDPEGKREPGSNLEDLTLPAARRRAPEQQSARPRNESARQPPASRVSRRFGRCRKSGMTSAATNGTSSASSDQVSGTRGKLT